MNLELPTLKEFIMIIIVTFLIIILFGILLADVYSW